MKIIVNSNSGRAMLMPPFTDVPVGYYIVDVPKDGSPPPPWKWEAGELVTAPATLPVPSKIANWQAKAILQLGGLLTDVEAAIDALPEETKIVVEAAWVGGADLYRNGATVAAIAASLNLDQEQVDTMFIDAAKLKV